MRPYVVIIAGYSWLAHMALGCCWHHPHAHAEPGHDAAMSAAVCCAHEESHTSRAEGELRSSTGDSQHSHPDAVCCGQDCVAVLSVVSLRPVAYASAQGLTCLSRVEDVNAHALSLLHGSAAPPGHCRVHLALGILLI